MSLKTALIIIFIFVEFLFRIMQLGFMKCEIDDFWLQVITFYSFLELSAFLIFSGIALFVLSAFYFDVDSKAPNKISKKIDKDS